MFANSEVSPRTVLVADEDDIVGAAAVGGGAHEEHESAIARFVVQRFQGLGGLDAVLRVHGDEQDDQGALLQLLRAEFVSHPAVEGDGAAESEVGAAGFVWYSFWKSCSVGSFFATVGLVSPALEL